MVKVVEVVSQEKCAGCEDLKLYLDDNYGEDSYKTVNISLMSDEEREKYGEENYIEKTPTLVVKEDGIELMRIEGFEENKTQEVDLVMKQVVK